MENPDKRPSTRPITARAAENGLRLGIFFCVVIALMGAGTQYPFLALIALGAAIALPFYAFSLLSKNCLRSGGFLSFPEIWAEGIASFFLGSLIPAALTYLALRFAFPDFIATQMQDSIDAFRALGTQQGDVWAQTIEKLRDEGLTPTPADVAANIISINIIAGTVLSLFMAITLSTRIRMRRMRQRQNNQ